ncbi:MAG: type II toxin-antitoxin system RelE/ParE family toxin [Desulfovibrio sp.]|nr:type II toxin-antitoxin system RelE/ParE family toxin [Desulfovibrio sp.]
MSSVLWSLPALKSRDALIRYIAADDIRAALALDDEISRAVERIASFPRSGRPGRISGTRELVVRPNYLIVYEELDRGLVVLALLHAAQLYPPDSGG